MKTGFVCASGFNIVNTATRTMEDGTERTVLSVVLGAPSQERRAEVSAALMDEAFKAELDGPVLLELEPYGDTETRTNLRSEICTQEAASQRYDGRDVEGRMVLDTDLITPRTRAPVTVEIEPQPPMPLPRQKPASLGGPADDGIEYAYGTPVPLMNPERGDRGGAGAAAPAADGTDETAGLEAAPALRASDPIAATSAN